MQKCYIKSLIDLYPHKFGSRAYNIISDYMIFTRLIHTFTLKDLNDNGKNKF